MGSGRSSQGEAHATTLQSDHVLNQADQEEEEHFDGDDLADAMSQLDLSTVLPPRTPIAQRRKDIEQTTTPAPAIDEPNYPVLAPPEYQSLNSIRGSSWERFGTPSGTAPLPTPPFTGKAALYGSGRSAKNRNTQKDKESGLPSDLMHAIYGGLTRRRGGKRFARLSMGDSSRWRVVRNSTPLGAFPPNAI